MILNYKLQFLYCNAYNRYLFQNVAVRLVFFKDCCCADATPISAALSLKVFLSVVVLFDPPQPPYKLQQLWNILLQKSSVFKIGISPRTN